MFASQVTCRKEFARFILPGSHYSKAQKQFTQILVKLKGKKSPHSQLIINHFTASKKNSDLCFPALLIKTRTTEINMVNRELIKIQISAI